MRPIPKHFSVAAPTELLRRFCACERGTNAIEFAFVMPMLVAILLVTIQVAVIFIAQSYLETVAEAGMRMVLTNQAQSAGFTQAQFQSAICANVTALFNCNNLIIALEPAPANAASMSASMPQFDSNGNLTATPPYNIAAMVPGAKGMLVVMYQWPVLGGPLGLSFSSLGNGALLLVATQVFQIEPST